jgi:hypothetical protein
MWGADWNDYRDHLTAVTGKLGAAPAMIPMELVTKSAFGEKTIRAQIVNHPKLTRVVSGADDF